jgi:hypothetical protein
VPPLARGIMRCSHVEGVNCDDESLAGFVSCSLKLDFPGENFVPKPPVTHEAEPWILKGYWFVVLKEEMIDPSKCVALNDCEGDEPPVLRDYGCAEKNHSQACSHEMQPARSSACMFAQVKWIELAEVAIGLAFVHLRLLQANVSVLPPNGIYINGRRCKISVKIA